jgi:hypothetical protein
MRPAYQIKRLSDMAGAMALARDLIGHDRWTAEELQAFQRRRLHAVVRHATTRSSFYRELYGGAGADGPVELDRLPAIDKAAVMERFDDLVTDRRLTLGAVEAHLDGLTRDELLLGRYRAMADPAQRPGRRPGPRPVQGGRRPGRPPRPRRPAPDAKPDQTVQLVITRLREKLVAQGVAHPAVDVELRDTLQDERDTAGKFKLVESCLRPAAAARR